MTQCCTCSLLFPSSHMHPHTLHTNVPLHYHVLTHTHPHIHTLTCTPSHAHLTHTHPHTCTPSHTHPHTCTLSQTPRVLYAVVLFDPLAADFNIDDVWLVMYNGQQRPLIGQRALQAVGTQINQKISPPDRVHIKVYISLGCPSLLFASSPFFTCPSLVFSPPPSPSFSVLHVH